MANDFFILGNGGSGTSLLRGLLNAHSEIECLFETWAANNKEIEANLEGWPKMAEECERVWGNKIPLEMFWTNGWTDEDIIKISDSFLTLWIVRRFETWSPKSKARIRSEHWTRSRAIYWAIRNRHPDHTLEISFEDLLLRTESELKRICNFLNVLYEAQMMEGLNDTGHNSFNYGEILIEKV